MSHLINFPINFERQSAEASESFLVNIVQLLTVNSDIYESLLQGTPNQIPLICKIREVSKRHSESPIILHSLNLYARVVIKNQKTFFDFQESILRFYIDSIRFTDDLERLVNHTVITNYNLSLLGQSDQKHITELHFPNFKNISRMIETIPDNILQPLEVLNLACTEIDASALLTILARTESLETLNLMDCKNLQGFLTAASPETLARIFQPVKKININSTGLNNAQSEKLMQALNGLISFKGKHNKILNYLRTAPPERFESLFKTIRTLDLSHSILDHFVLLTILNHATQIKKLDISQCTLGTNPVQFENYVLHDFILSTLDVLTLGGEMPSNLIAFLLTAPHALKKATLNFCPAVESIFVSFNDEQLLGVLASMDSLILDETTYHNSLLEKVSLIEKHLSKSMIITKTNRASVQITFVNKPNPNPGNP